MHSQAAILDPVGFFSAPVTATYLCRGYCRGSRCYANDGGMYWCYAKKSISRRNRLHVNFQRWTSFRISNLFHQPGPHFRVVFFQSILAESFHCFSCEKDLESDFPVWQENLSNQLFPWRGWRIVTVMGSSYLTDPGIINWDRE